jgi:hypothetical protein
MKKFILITIMFLLSQVGYSQWVTRNIDNGLDQPYRIAYAEDDRHKVLLKLEATESTIALYVTGSYYCSDYPVVDLAFKVGEENRRHTVIGKKSHDSKTVFIVLDLLGEDKDDFLKDFKQAKKLIMRINEETCTDDYYSFVMTNSSTAFNFMMREIRKD